MCNHDQTHEQIINTSIEVWRNGVGEWVEQESAVLCCDSCGAIFNKETNRWEM